jgi:hypothetical protein
VRQARLDTVLALELQGFTENLVAQVGGLLGSCSPSAGRHRGASLGSAEAVRQVRERAVGRMAEIEQGPPRPRSRCAARR